MSWDAREEPRCGTCKKPTKLSARNEDAVSSFFRLASRRVWDGSSGAPRPLPLSEVRLEAERTPDPDATEARVLALDAVWLEEAAKRREAEDRRRKAKAKAGRR